MSIYTNVVDLLGQNPRFSDHDPHRLHHNDLSFRNDRLAETFLLGDRTDGRFITELYPNKSKLLTFLEQISKGSQDRPIDYKSEHRGGSGAFRRLAYVKETKTCTVNAESFADLMGIKVCSPFNRLGKKTRVKLEDINPTGSWDAEFYQPKDYFVQNDTVQFHATCDVDGQGARKVIFQGTVANIPHYSNAQKGAYAVLDIKLTHVDGDALDKDGYLKYNGKEFTVTKSFALQKNGNAFAEGSSITDGRGLENHAETRSIMQIFKTVTKKFSGTMSATRYAGKQHPIDKMYDNMLEEHVVDIAKAIITNGTGYVDPSNIDIRMTDGLIHTIRKGGGFVGEASYSSDHDSLSQFFFDWGDPETGTDGILDDEGVLHGFTSRNIIHWFRGLGNGSFTSNTFASNPALRGIINIDGNPRPIDFGSELQMGGAVQVTLGDRTLMLHEEMQLSNPLYNSIILFPNFNYVKYNVLEANGNRREQVVEKYVKTGSEDGFRHTVLTEAGLDIGLIEAHGILSFNTGTNNFASNFNY